MAYSAGNQRAVGALSLNMSTLGAAVSTTTISNIESRQRVQAVDVLRGLALIGMLLVHFQYYVHDDSLWSGRINEAVDFLAVDRFYPLFAFLFGTGFTLQLTRWGGRPGFVPMYLRKLTALMAFAAILIASTGYRVLESYAFWALPLLAVRRWSNRAIVVLVLCCAFAHPTVEFATWQWEKRHMTVAESNAKVSEELRYWPDAIREQDRLRDEATFSHLAAFRLRMTFSQYLRWQNYVPGDPLMMFLLGMLAVRLNVFQDPLRYRKFLVGIIIVGAFAGVMSNLAGSIFHFDSYSSSRLGLAARRLTYSIFDERFQGMAYAAAILLWIAKSSSAQRMSRFLAYPGRLSLTNYVVQVAILEILFASSTPIISLNRWEALIGVIVVFALQIAFSQWWITRYRYGPLEWLWRSITFSRWEPLRREVAQPAV
jgi:uncharacterized protein